MEELCTQRFMQLEELHIEQFKEPEDNKQLPSAIQQYINYLNQSQDDLTQDHADMDSSLNSQSSVNKRKWRQQIYEKNKYEEMIFKQQQDELLKLQNKELNQEQVIKKLEMDKKQQIQLRKEKTDHRITEAQEKRKQLERQKLQKVLNKQK